MRESKKLIIFILVLVCCCLGGVLYYFLYLTKTPAYSFNIMRQAVEQQDVVLFEKHFDTDSFFNKAFDDMILAQEKITGTEISTNPLGAGLLSLMKPHVVSSLKASMLDQVGGTTQQAGQNDIDKLAEGMEEKLPLFFKFKDVDVISQEGSLAHVAVTLYDEKLDTDFILKFKMQRLSDDTWQIKECTNLVDFYLTKEKKIAAKLEQLNKPMQEKMNQALIISRENIIRSNNHNPYFPTYILENNLQVQNNSTQAITHFAGQLQLFNAQQQVVYSQNYFYDKSIAAGAEKDIQLHWDLNPFVKEEQRLIKADMAGLQGNNRITAITYVDGTKLELLDKLP